LIDNMVGLAEAESCSACFFVSLDAVARHTE